ncbi:hypothetical protein L2E82_25802 [Cichorium intybus]|uniref:Uncharacterized protein n=1 Tax=Cichorium intybus TaxID=13427 RepID=A0ACB9E4T1_CICIN|nr:hypothetical protein L2E82_25802 [Cichorium intybus]
MASEMNRMKGKADDSIRELCKNVFSDPPPKNHGGEATIENDVERVFQKRKTSSEEGTEMEADVSAQPQETTTGEDKKRDVEDATPMVKDKKAKVEDETLGPKTAPKITKGVLGDDVAADSSTATATATATTTAAAAAAAADDAEEKRDVLVFERISDDDIMNMSTNRLFP